MIRWLRFCVGTQVQPLPANAHRLDVSLVGQNESVKTLKPSSMHLMLTQP